MADINSSPKGISSPVLGDPVPVNVTPVVIGRGPSPRDPNLPLIDPNDPNSRGNRIDNPQEPKGNIPSPSEPDYPDPENRDATRDDLTNPGGSQNDDVIFAPDSSLSPQENLDNLVTFLNSLFSSSRYGGNLLSGVQYANVLAAASAAVWRLSKTYDLSPDQQLSLSEKVADLSYSFIQSQYQMALSYQSWYLQQEYNSPLQQVNRLTEAGLSSSFVFGGLSSGNAQSSALLPKMQEVAPSGAGGLGVQERANDFSLIGQLVGAASSFLPGAAGAMSSLISSFATKRLTAKQIQLSDSEIVNNAATYEVLRSNLQDIQSNLAYRDFDKQFDLSKFAVDTARKNVESAKSAYDTSLLLGTKTEQVEAYRTVVEDKSGHRKTVDIDVNDMEQLQNNNWTTTDGFRVVGVDSSSTGASGSLSSSLQDPFGFIDAKVSGTLSHTDSTSKSDEKSGTKQSGRSVGSKVGTTNQKFNESGTEFHVGNAKFVRVYNEKKVSLPEHKAYIDSCLKRYQKALDEYNTLSTGERARLLDMLDHLQQSLTSFSSKVSFNSYMRKINDFFKPDIFVGD